MVCIIVLSYKAVLKGRPGGELPALFESLYQLKNNPTHRRGDGLLQADVVLNKTSDRLVMWASGSHEPVTALC